MTQATSITVGLDTSALDAGFKAHALRGIGRYVYELKRYFDDHPHEQVRVASFNHREFHNGSVLNRLIDKVPVGRNTIRQQLYYPLRLSARSERRFDFIHFPAHMDAPSWSLKNYVLTVLDLIPLVLADLYKANRPTWRFAFARWLEIRAIKNARFILAISENTARDVHRILGIPRERIMVTPLGVNEFFFEPPRELREDDLRSRLGIPLQRRIILYTGGIDPRKNYRGLIESFKELAERTVRSGRVERPYLAMAGEIRSDREFPRLAELVTNYGLEQDVGFLGFVPDEDLRSLYALSALFFFPSLYEGFGLTPLEAMAARVPVVSSDRSCMPEVLGDAALLVNPEDPRDCAEKMMAVLDNTELADDLRARGTTRARLFPWSKTAAATLDAYRYVASGKAA